MSASHDKILIIRSCFSKGHPCCHCYYISSFATGQQCIETRHATAVEQGLRGNNEREKGNGVLINNTSLLPVCWKPESDDQEAKSEENLKRAKSQ